MYLYLTVSRSTEFHVILSEGSIHARGNPSLTLLTTKAKLKVNCLSEITYGACLKEDFSMQLPTVVDLCLWLFCFSGRSPLKLGEILTAYIIVPMASRTTYLFRYYPGRSKQS